MDFFNKFRKFTDVRNSAGIALAGLVIAVITAAVLLAEDSGEFVKTMAVVETVETEQDGDQISVSAVSVGFTAGGKQYSGVFLSSFSGDLSVGDEIEIEYNMDDPKDARQPGGKMMAGIICGVGVLACLFGVMKTVNALGKKSTDYEQFNKVKYREVSEEMVEKVRSQASDRQNYVCHFDGHLNQDFVMKDSRGELVCEALCEKLQLIKDTKYTFRFSQSGKTEEKMVGHTISESAGSGFCFRVPISSAFKIDGKSCWEVLADMGYGFDFSLRGLTCCYDVNHYGVPVARIEDAGTEAMNSKWEGNPLAKIPAKGIFRVSCGKADIQAVFFICFVLNRVELFSSGS